MRALCINGDFSGMRNRKDYSFVKHFPVEGETYEVEAVNDTGGYALMNVDAGVSPFTGRPFTFFKSRFIPLEDWNEEELCEMEEDSCFIQR